MRTSRHQGSKKAPQDFSHRAFMYDIQLFAWFRFPDHPCYHYIRKRKSCRPRLFFSAMVGSAISASASSGTPGSLRFSYTTIIHIGALDFRSKVSTSHRTAFCSFLWCPAIPASCQPACHGSLRFSLHYNYTHRRTGFLSKSFHAANVGITNAVISGGEGRNHRRFIPPSCSCSP